MTTRAYRPARVLAVLALAVPLAGTLVGVSALPASASGSFTSPQVDQVFDDSTTARSGAAVAVKANVTVSPGKSATLTVTGPGGPYPISKFSNGDLVFTKNGTVTVNAGIKASDANGKYTGTLTGDATGSRFFYTNFKPETPTAFTGTPKSSTEIDFTWTSGAEPDLLGFSLYDASGSLVQELPASVCSGSTCSYAKTDYNSPDPGTTIDYTYTLTARRSSGGCSNCGGFTESGKSSSTTAQLAGPPPPSPSPTPTPTGGSTTGGTTGGTSGTTTGTHSGGTTGSATGGTTGTHSGGTSGSGSTVKPITIPTLPPIVASRRTFALGFNKFSPSLGIPKLPPLPATTFPAPTVGSASDTYKNTLPYASPPKKTTSVFSSPAAVVRSLDTAQLAKSLAVALLLLVCAAHVRLFLSSGSDD